MSVPFSATVLEKGIRFEKPDEAQANIRARFTVGEVVLVTVDEFSKLRSLLQNNYLHAEPIRKFCAYTGNTPSQQKLELLGEYFGWIQLKSGAMVPAKPSTTELTTREFSEWVEWLVQFGAEQGLNILPPEKNPRRRDSRVRT